MIKKIFRYFKIYSPKTLLSYLRLEIKSLLNRSLGISYSQWGEDLIINNLLNKKKKGFYVDIGAYDPTRFSNTKLFYLKGWQGINIEPNSIRINKFYKERPKDLNLNFGVANKNGSLNFFKFSPQTLSTFSRETAKKYKKQGYQLNEIIKIKVLKLSKILEKNTKKKTIDFLSIDTEGFDLEVLQSNNWKKFKPKVICIEGQGNNPEKLLTKLGYKKIYETRTNSIFNLTFGLVRGKKLYPNQTFSPRKLHFSDTP